MESEKIHQFNKENRPSLPSFDKDVYYSVSYKI